jgi:hypothetical protein
MTPVDIVRQRLYNQRLVGRQFKTPEEAVQHSGAVQAQDFTGAKWSLGLRTQDTSDKDIEGAFNDGRILRTHVMRPTWHFVLPEDIRWMLALTAPRIRQTMGYYDRKLELTDALLTKSKRIITDALKENQYMTREELGKELVAAGIEASGQRLGHIVGHAEFDALICSGPRRGKQFTYALVEERAPDAKELSRDESLATLASRYYQSHGPATLKDFAVWAGLTIKDGQKAVSLITPKLQDTEVDGKVYYSSPSAPKPADIPSPFALMLSVYDEYTIAYRDWDFYCERELEQKLVDMGNALQNLMVVDGRIVGSWRRNIRGRQLSIEMNPLSKLSSAEKSAIEEAARRYVAFAAPIATEIK